MTQWYYAKDGKQYGPMGLEDLRSLIASGAINPATDLVWNQGMPNWLVAAQVPEIAGDGMVAAGYQQPFAYQTAEGPLAEIEPGSEPIIATACIKRGFQMTVAQIGPIIAAAVIYLVITIGLSFAISLVGGSLGFSDPFPGMGRGAPPQSSEARIVFAVVSNLVSGFVGMFVLLGATRIALDAVSGKPVSVGQLFGSGKYLLRAFGGYIIYIVIVSIGTVLLVFPGIYLALRYSQYIAAMLDRDMGVIESFKYSAELTKNNKLNLFVIWLLSLVMIFAGCLALGVGLIFVYPVILVSWVVAYRWMQYGGRAILDDPMKGKPMLADLPE